MDAVTGIPPIVNEPIHSYAPGHPETHSLKARLQELAGEQADLTMTIGGRQRMGGGEKFSVVAPHRHRLVLGETAQATQVDVEAAIDAALAAAPGWRELPFDERAAVFLRAADLLSTTWRDRLNAATMLGQSKTVQQAEIDSACELADFLRFNVHFARQILAEQPHRARPELWNRMDYRPLEGFVLAITPVQLHRDRRQPAVRAGAAGQRRRVEAVADAAAGRALHHAAVRSGRTAARRDQHGDRRRRRVSEVALPAPGPGRHPLHRLDRDLPAPVARGGRGHRVVRDLSAAGRRDRRQGLRPRPPIGRSGDAGDRRWCAARSSTRARSARRRRAPTCRGRCGTAGCATSSSQRPSR